MTSYSLHALIIKRHNFREADRIITVYSQEQGKVNLIARGIRKITSRRAGSLELFNLVKLSVVTGRGDLDIITEVQLLDSFPSWKKFLGRITLAYRLSEVVDKLTPFNQPAPEVYQSLVTCFSSIAALDANWQAVTRNWLLNLIRLLGFWPEDKPFSGDLDSLLEDLSERPLQAGKLLKRLGK